MKEKLIAISIGVLVLAGSLFVSYEKPTPVINDQLGAGDTPAKGLGRVTTQRINEDATGNEEMVYIETSDGWSLSVNAASIHGVFQPGDPIETKKQAVRDYLLARMPKEFGSQVATIYVDDNGNVTDIDYLLVPNE